MSKIIDVKCDFCSKSLVVWHSGTGDHYHYDIHECLLCHKRSCHYCDHFGLCPSHWVGISDKQQLTVKKIYWKYYLYQILIWAYLSIFVASIILFFDKIGNVLLIFVLIFFIVLSSVLGFKFGEKYQKNVREQITEYINYSKDKMQKLKEDSNWLYGKKNH